MPARITAFESRAIGVHVELRAGGRRQQQPANPVINTRSFGEQPDAVGRLRDAPTCADCTPAACSPRSNTFPATATPTWTRTSGCRSSASARAARSDGAARRFAPGLAAGADAVMSAHIQLPALDPAEFSPATLSRADRHRPASRRDEVRRPRLHRLDGHGRRRASGCRPATPPSRAIRPATTSCCIRRTMRRRWRRSRRRS